MTDPIADMLTRIRNAVTAKQTRVDMPASRLKSDIDMWAAVVKKAGLEPH